jgi:predicted RNase H-like HicB family nuclease/DNA-binding XRE family transcriptional regulator
MIKYPFEILKMNDDGQYFLVKLLGFEENYVTQAENIEEALENAVDVINLALEDYLENNQIKKPIEKTGSNIHYVTPSLEYAIPMMLRIEREKRGLSAPAVAQALGVPYQNYWRIEKGERKNLTLATLQKIVAIFGHKLDVNFV